MCIHVRIQILETVGHVTSGKEIMEMKIMLTALKKRAFLLRRIINSRYGNLVPNIWMEKIGKFMCWIRRNRRKFN